MSFTLIVEQYFDKTIHIDIPFLQLLPADGVMNFGVEDINDLDYYWESINMDDIAMPGSFWLNPPHPKDDEGNGVDVLSVIELYEETEREQNNQQETTGNNVTTPLDPEDDDRYLASILMDMDPL